MGCLKLAYYEAEPTLKVAYRNGMASEKVVQGFLSVDPLAEKYPNISPYAYVANNPIIAIDPNGKEIIIVGSDCTEISYKPGMKYEGNDKFTADAINRLNDMNSVKQGNKVLDYVVSNKQKLTITNELILIKGAESAVGLVKDSSAGTLKLGNANGEINLNAMSHEIFHSYQHMKGQGGASINNEVEAYLFGDLIEAKFYNYGEDRLGTLFENGDDFDWFDLTRTFTEKPFNSEDFTKMVNDFKTKSGANKSGLYNNYPLKRENQIENLYKEFHPIEEDKK